MRFSIRDILLLTVIAALATAWWLDHRRKSIEIARFQRQERRHWLDLQLAKATATSEAEQRAALEHVDTLVQLKLVTQELEYQIQEKEDRALASRGYLDLLRHQKFARPPSRMPLELSTEPAPTKMAP